MTGARLGDLWGGLAAMLVALPSAIAYGLLVYTPLGPELAARGALAGIVGTVAVAALAAPLGGTPRLVSAPCAPAAALLAALATELAGRGLVPDAVLLRLAIVAALAAVLQCLFGAVGGGRLIKYIPYPVVAGYLSGVGALILLGQLPRLLGFPAGTPLLAGLGSPAAWSRSGIVVGAVTIVTILLAPRLTGKLPATILGLAAGVAAYFLLGLGRPEMLRLDGNPLVIGWLGDAGSLAAAAPGERFRQVAALGIADLDTLAFPALALAVLLSIDTLKTCLVVDTLTGSRHDSSRELRGQGIANLASAALGGMPGAGQMGGTLVNIGSGGASRWSGFFTGVLALAAFLLLGRLLAWVPVAGLAGILIVVAVRMMDRSVLRLARHRSTVLDLAVIAAVVATALVADLIAATGVGLGLSVLLFVREQARSSVVRRKAHGNARFSRTRRLPEEMAVLESRGAGTVICELQGSLFFGTTDQLFRELESDLAACRYLVLDMRRVQSMDYTAAHVFGQMKSRLGGRGGMLVFSNIPASLPSGRDIEAYLAQTGLVGQARAGRVFPQLEDALEWIEDRTLEEELGRAPEARPLDLAEIDLLRGLDEAALRALGACASRRSFGKGERVFAQGDTGDEIFLVASGLVRVITRLDSGRDLHLATFGRGDFFGDMAFLDRAPRSADAVCETEAHLYQLSRREVDAVALGHPGLGLAVFSRLARALALRLRQADGELRALAE